MNCGSPFPLTGFAITNKLGSQLFPFAVILNLERLYPGWRVLPTRVFGRTHINKEKDFLYQND